MSKGRLPHLRRDLSDRMAAGCPRAAVSNHPDAQPERQRRAPTRSRFLLLPLGSAKDREQFRWDEDLDTARDPRLPSDQPGSFEGDHHLVDGWWTDAEVSLQVGFGGRPTEDARIGIDER